MDRIKQIMPAEKDTVAVYKRTVNGKIEWKWEPIICWALMEDTELTPGSTETFDFVVALNHRQGMQYLSLVSDDLGEGWQFDSYAVCRDDPGFNPKEG